MPLGLTTHQLKQHVHQQTQVQQQKFSQKQKLQMKTDTAAIPVQSQEPWRSSSSLL